MTQHTHTQNEEWRPVVGYEKRYEVSNFGRVRTIERLVLCRNGINRLIRQQFMSPFVSKDGHLRVGLRSEDGTRRKHWVHVLVLEAFVCPRPHGLIALHKDGNPRHNTPDNLRWGTHSENAFDAVLHGAHWESNKERCKRGHLLEEWNIERTELSKRNKRTCKSCRYAHSRAQHHPEIKNNLKAWADARYLKFLESNNVSDPEFRPSAI